MRYFAAVLAAAIAGVLATPARAAENSQKVERKTVIVTTGGDEGPGEQGSGKYCRIVTIGEDGEKKVIRLKGGQLLDGDEKLDTDTRLRLLDARIANLKATAQLKTDLAVKRLEVEKLELAGKSDADVVAKKKEINALKTQLADAKLDYEQTVKKLVPEDMYELYMLEDGNETGLLDLNFGLPAGGEKRIIKRIELRDDGEDSD